MDGEAQKSYPGFFRVARRAGVRSAYLLIVMTMGFSVHGKFRLSVISIEGLFLGMLIDLTHTPVLSARTLHVPPDFSQSALVVGTVGI